MAKNTNEPNEEPIRRVFGIRLSEILETHDEGNAIPEPTFLEYRKTKAEMFRTLAELHHPGHKSDHYHHLASLQDSRTDIYYEKV